MKNSWFEREVPGWDDVGLLKSHFTITVQRIVSLSPSLLKRDWWPKFVCLCICLLVLDKSNMIHKTPTWFVHVACMNIFIYLFIYFVKDKSYVKKKSEIYYWNVHLYYRNFVACLQYHLSPSRCTLTRPQTTTTSACRCVARFGVSRRGPSRRTIPSHFIASLQFANKWKFPL